MSTLLQLFQNVKRDCKIPGAEPSTAQSQTGILGDLVYWVIRAWDMVQLKEQDWRWMFGTFTLPTVDGTHSYAYGSCTDVAASAVITRLGRWHIDKRVNRWKIYLVSAGQSTENELITISYDQFQSLYRLGANASTTGYPVHVAISPDNKILLGPTPNGIYTVTGQYYKSKQTLSANADIPEMPTDFHPLIEAEAMLLYAEDQSAPELEKKAKRLMRTYYSRLRNDQLPKTKFCGPLA